jgi:transcriptional regulator with XRE-family HTH domain
MRTKQASAVEQEIINKVRSLRISKGISQAELANLIDKPHGFIGRVESPNQPDRYNVNHINEIAKALKCSLWDIFPEKPL